MPAMEVELVEALVRMGLVERGAPPPMTPLPGGVSSDIWKVDLPSGPVCVKRALPKLKVAQEWRAPVGRNAYEVEWMREASRAAPGSTPRLIAADGAAGLFVMEFLDPATHKLWKTELRDGRAEPGTGRAVGGRLARIHAESAGRAEVAARFRTDEIFHAIRLEPYLEATARRHPDLGGVLNALAARTAGTKRALVHGDVSPKNILIGPAGPVFLDAECAWYGDPAFDLAFCLNHLLLKCVWRPASTSDFLACFDSLASAYLNGAAWEPREELEGRAASLLPALLLARVDGKSPVEFITEEKDRDLVRGVARPLIASSPSRLSAVRGAWWAAVKDRRVNEPDGD